MSHFLIKQQNVLDTAEADGLKPVHRNKVKKIAEKKVAAEEAGREADNKGSNPANRRKPH